MEEKLPPAQQRIINYLLANGWREDNHTDKETINDTTHHLHDQPRFLKGIRRIAVGKHHTIFFIKTGHELHDFNSVPTKDFDIITTTAANPCT